MANYNWPFQHSYTDMCTKHTRFLQICVRNIPVSYRYVYETHPFLTDMCTKHTRFLQICVRNIPISYRYRPIFQLFYWNISDFVIISLWNSISHPKAVLPLRRCDCDSIKKTNHFTVAYWSNLQFVMALLPPARPRCDDDSPWIKCSRLFSWSNRSRVASVGERSKGRTQVETVR
jgi:hypothetical protein